MRKLGFFVLFFGFFWLAMDQIDTLVTSNSWPLVTENLDALSKTRPACNSTQACYSAEEIEKYTHKVIRSAYEDKPLYIIPGAFMLFGGILLALSSRKMKSNVIAKEMAGGNRG